MSKRIEKSYDNFLLNYIKESDEADSDIDTTSGNLYLPITYPETLNNAIFLAGPCPRKPEQSDWRDEFVEKIREKGFTGDIISPTNRKWDSFDENYYDKQTTWEQTMMKWSSVVVFYIPRTEESPAFTTNIEYGIWSCKSNNLIVGIPDGSMKNDYIKHDCKRRNIPLGTTMEEVIDLILERFSKKQKTFFTSDTHFGAKRTYELSKRPFTSVDDMDNMMISNWNKTITNNDIVYHLGDFGDAKYLPLLNFKELIILEGNYEHDTPLKIPNLPNKTITIEKKSFSRELSNGDSVIFTHEPIMLEDTEYPENSFYFFGHAHHVNFKRNGINVGVDCNNYYPMSEEDCIFWKEAVLKFYDDNVFCENCEKIKLR